MTSAHSSNSNFPENDFNLLEDSEDADNHNSAPTATRLSLQFQLDESYLGQRIDQVAALVWNDFSREKLKQWMKDGHLLVNGNIVKPKYRCEGNELLTLEVELEAQTSSQPENIPLNIVYEDDDIIVINKPSGLVVHPAAGHAQDTLVNALIFHTKSLSMKFGEQRPGIVHRLDKETSGVLVVAKNDRAHENLTRQFKERTIHRIYHAVTIGLPKPQKGVIQSYLARHPGDRKKYASVLGPDKKIQTTKEPISDIGKWASTTYEVLTSSGGLSYCKLKLETGRTHQIRVHLSEKGCPIVGDIVYGADKKAKALESKNKQVEIKKLNRFLLHATELGFAHPTTGNYLSFSKDWPDEIQDLLTLWKLDENHRD